MVLKRLVAVRSSFADILDVQTTSYSHRCVDGQSRSSIHDRGIKRNTFLNANDCSLRPVLTGYVTKCYVS